MVLAVIVTYEYYTSGFMGGTEHYLQKEKNNPFGVLLLIRCCWCGSRTLRPPRVEAKLWLFSAHSLKPTCCKGVVLSFQ